MKIPLIRIILIAILIISASTIEANSQSAWVLWEQYKNCKTHVPWSDWQVNSAYPTYEMCIKKREECIKMWKNTWKVREDNPHLTKDGKEVAYTERGFIIMDESNQALFLYEAQCLPETIDPRK